MIILTTVKIHTIFYPYTSLLDKYCEKKGCVIINAENLKQDMALQDIFPLSHWRAFNSWDRGLLFGYKGLIFNCQLQIREGKQCMPLF